MSNKPWDMPGVPFKTEGAFWNWVKGVLRKGWSRHPVKVQYMRSIRFKAPLGRVTTKNPKGMVWAINCEICNECVRESKAQCDHIRPSELERWYNDIDAFVKRMYFVTFDDLQGLCIPCHEIKTYADKKGCSFEESKTIYKPLIEFKNKKAKEQIDTLREIGIIPGKNQETRVSQFEGWLKRKAE